MTQADSLMLFDVIDTTWPSEAQQHVGPWIIRNGAGGGNRVSAATANGTVRACNVAPAEQAMRALGQKPLFQMRPSDEATDAVLDRAGYVVRDETALYAASITTLTTQRPPPVTAFTVWPPLAAQTDIWAQGGVGPARLAVMDRVSCTKTTFLGRIDDRPAATLFVAVHGGIAMLHALEVAPAFRRRGLAQQMTRAAAFWAQARGATTFSLLATTGNGAANALYQGLGMTVVAGYHYRALPKDAS